MKFKLDPGAFPPKRAHVEDAGLDIFSRESMLVPAHGSAIFRTGVHVELRMGETAFLKSKSGLYMAHDITSEGVVDCGYDGEIIAKLINHGSEDYMVERGDKITQLVILPCNMEDVEIVDEIRAGERGSAGFGSTGK